MYHFIESIRVIKGKAELMDFHQARLERTFAHFFKRVNAISLDSVINNNPPPDNKRYKLRVEYSKEISSIQYLPYERRKINRLLFVELPDDFLYNYKFSERSILNELCKNFNNDTLPIFIQKGMVTDSLFANLVFKEKSTLYTPNTPLLCGVQREFLLKSKIIKTKSIQLKDVREFEGVFLINAMMSLSEAIYVPISQIG